MTCSGRGDNPGIRNLGRCSNPGTAARLADRRRLGPLHPVPLGEGFAAGAAPATDADRAVARGNTVCESEFPTPAHPEVTPPDRCATKSSLVLTVRIWLGQPGPWHG